MKGVLREKNTYILRFDRGEEVIEGLKNFCETDKIAAGRFSAIGATQNVTLSHYDPDIKKYSDRDIAEKLEIISLLGNVAIMDEDERVVIHAHGSFSNPEMQVVAGHVKRLVVSATCELVLQKIEGKIERGYSEEIGLNLMK